jgi:hypothetical protein
MDKATRHSVRFQSALAITNVLFTILAGCGGPPIYDEGPLCDEAATLDWSPAATRPELDHVDFATWTTDPELEQRLLDHGLATSRDHLGGNDINADGIVVSPYGKTLNAYELIVTTPGLEGWGDYLRQNSYPVHLSCGEKARGVVAHTYYDWQQIDVYPLFYDRNVVSRAGFLIHEAGHAARLPEHANTDQDQSWDDGGTYALQLEFLAAVYYAPELSEDHKKAAKKEFEWLMGAKFVEPTGLTLEDLR